MSKARDAARDDEWRARRTAAYRSLGLRGADIDLDGGLRLGRVSIVHGSRANVIWFDDVGGDVETSSHVAPGLRSRLVAGDWVGLRDGQIVSVLERHSELRRPDPRRPDVQVLASNVDLVLLVLAIDRGLNDRLLERFAVMAWDSGARPFVILTKADHAIDTAETEQRVRSLVPGVELLTTSSHSGQGIERLRALLRHGVTAVMLGASGAGKTSLLNALEGTSELTRAVRRSGDGRHATSTRRLYRLSHGGVLLDIPGIRLVDLAGQSGIDETFTDIEMIADRCRFRNCSHRGDDGCAVESALAAGVLAATRLASWRRIQAELAVRPRAANQRTRRPRTDWAEDQRRPPQDEPA